MFISQMPDSNRFYLGTIRWEKKKKIQSKMSFGVAMAIHLVNMAKN
jgi:hypothetical protein